MHDARYDPGTEGGGATVRRAGRMMGTIRLDPAPAGPQTYDQRTDARLDALEGESLPARVARLEMALNMVINALYAVNRDAALAASRALAGIMPGADGLVVRGELNAGQFLEGVETVAGTPPKLDLGTPAYEQRLAEAREWLGRREAGGE